jgi:metal-responsive CopG/Arc/MetJ family transcriptional regulator
VDFYTQRRLDAEIQTTGKKRSEIVREALAAYFRRHQVRETCLDLARRHRLIACAKRRLPPDLSTNRRHLEGFGR